MSHRTYAYAALPLLLGLTSWSCDSTPSTASGAGGSVGTGGSSSGGAASATGGSTATGSTANAAYTAGKPIALLPGSGAVPYELGPNAYGIRGGAFLARSSLGNSTVKLTNAPGKICLSGTVEKVPTPADGSHPPYGAYWGIQLGFNLNQPPAAGAGGAGGAAAAGGAGGAGVAGATAGGGAPAVAPAAWMPGEVVGFSIVLQGPKMSEIRFKALPFGLDPAAESSDKCTTLQPTSGKVIEVLFTDLTQYCWSPGNPVIDTSKGLSNFSIQIAANTEGAIPFDWCLTELRPLLAKNGP